MSFLLVVLLADLPPLCFIDGALLKYFGIPIGITWLMNKKTFDGKKPFNFLKSVFLYLYRPKVTYLGKPVKLENGALQKEKILVGSERSGLSN